MKKVDYNSWRSMEGKYDFAHPSKVETQIIFDLRDGAPEIKRGFTYDHERYGYPPKDSTAYDAAYFLKGIYDTYTYCGSMKDLLKLIEYLEPFDEDDYRNALLNRKAIYEEKLAEVDSQLARIQ